MASRREIRCRRCGSQLLVPPQAPAVQCRLCRTVTRLRPIAPPLEPTMIYGAGAGRFRPSAAPTEPTMNYNGAGRLRPTVDPPSEPVMNYGGSGRLRPMADPPSESVMNYGGAGRLRPTADPPTEPIINYGGAGRLQPTVDPPSESIMNYGGGRLRPTADPPSEPVMNYGGGGRLRPTADPPSEPVMNYGGAGRLRPTADPPTEPIINYGGAGRLRPTVDPPSESIMNYGGGRLRPTADPPSEPVMNYGGGGRLRPTADPPSEPVMNYGGAGRLRPMANPLTEPTMNYSGAGRLRPTATPTGPMNHGGGGRFGLRFNSSNEAAIVPVPASHHANPMSPTNTNNGYGYSRPMAQSPPVLVAPPPTHGRRRALLCGVSYYGRNYSLKGSINDVRAMRSLLVNKLGFPPDSVLTLSEDETNPLKIPTKQNMRLALKWLIQGCQAGDSLVFHYSGHGSRQKDYNGDEIDGYDEALCPTDYETEGMIIDDEVNATIVRPLPKGAKLHAIMDTCYSGTLLDLHYLCRMNKEGQYAWEDQRLPSAAYKGTSGGLALCFSACDDNETSADTTAFSDSMTGAMTYSFVQALTKEPGLTYGTLLNSMRCTIREAKNGLRINGQMGANMEREIKTNIAQEPQLSASHKFSVYKNKFLL